MLGERRIPTGPACTDRERDREAAKPAHAASINDKGRARQSEHGPVVEVARVERVGNTVRCVASQCLC